MTLTTHKYRPTRQGVCDDCGRSPRALTHQHPAASYTSCGFETCSAPATGYAPWPTTGYASERRSACDGHGSDGSLTRATARQAREAAILEGQPFAYEVVGYGRTADEALSWAQAWQARNGSDGPGSALYGPTVPLSWGEPYQPAWLTESRGRGHQEWRVPVQWVVANLEPHPMAVEGLRAGDLVHLDHEVVRLTSPAAGTRTGSRETGYPSIMVGAYGRVVGMPTTLDSARHLSWPAGTLVLVARP